MKTSEKRELILNQLQAQRNFKSEIFEGDLLMTYTNVKGKPVFALLPNKKSKLEQHYSFLSEEQRENRITEVKNSLKISAESTERYKKSRDKENEDIQSGTILYTSYGYEQTNINFYKVLERTGTVVTLVEVGQHREYYQQDCGETMPNADKIISDPFKKRISKHGVKMNDYSHATIFGGKKISWSSYN